MSINTQNDGMSQGKSGELFVRLCRGISQRRGGGVRGYIHGENGPSLHKLKSSNPLDGPSTNKFEASNSANDHLNSTLRFSLLDYIYSEINHIKTTHSRPLTKSESLQINLCTRMHNLFHDDVSDPLELILAVVNDEGYKGLPELPHGKQPLLDASRCNNLTNTHRELFKAKAAINLLLEVGLGVHLMTRLENLTQQLETKLKAIRSSYKAGVHHGRN